MSYSVFSVLSLDGLVHRVTGGWCTVTSWNLSYPAMQVTDQSAFKITAENARWECTGAPAPAGLKVVGDPVTCMMCIAGDRDA